jgi:hypothetical protein
MVDLMAFVLVERKVDEKVHALVES